MKTDEMIQERGQGQGQGQGLVQAEVQGEIGRAIVSKSSDEPRSGAISTRPLTISCGRRDWTRPWTGYLGDGSAHAAAMWVEDEREPMMDQGPVLERGHGQERDMKQGLVVLTASSAGDARYDGTERAQLVGAETVLNSVGPWAVLMDVPT